MLVSQSTYNLSFSSILECVASFLAMTRKRFLLPFALHLLPKNSLNFPLNKFGRLEYSTNMPILSGYNRFFIHKALRFFSSCILTFLLSVFKGRKITSFKKRKTLSILVDRLNSFWKQTFNIARQDKLILQTDCRHGATASTGTKNRLSRGATTPTRFGYKLSTVVDKINSLWIQAFGIARQGKPVLQANNRVVRQSQSLFSNSFLFFTTRQTYYSIEFAILPLQGKLSSSHSKACPFKIPVINN